MWWILLVILYAGRRASARNVKPFAQHPSTTPAAAAVIKHVDAAVAAAAAADQVKNVQPPAVRQAADSFSQRNKSALAANAQPGTTLDRFKL